MACFKPLHGYWDRQGPIRFGPSGTTAGHPIEVACGQCYGCRLERSRQWAVRCMHEATLHERNCFLTLTYDKTHLPKNGSLRTRDWQLFAKRMRKARGAFRFFHCGEYGDNNYRPHYHAAIFGHDFREDRMFLKNNKRGEPLYTSARMAGLWPSGFHAIGELTFESARYVARYIMKKVTGDLAESHYERVDTDTGEIYQLQPEYVTMSRRPGIASEWIEKYMYEVYPADEVIVDGKKTPPPKYYDRCYEQRDPKGWALVVEKRKANAKKHEQDYTPERLAVREEVARAATRQQTREI